MDEFRHSDEFTEEGNETNDRREEIKNKLRQYYDGRIFWKDLTQKSRLGAHFGRHGMLL